jgi:hypothetical protein
MNLSTASKKVYLFGSSGISVETREHYFPSLDGRGLRGMIHPLPNPDLF